MLRNMADNGRFESARRALAEADPVLSTFIETIGPCRLAPAPDPFVALSESPIHQKLLHLIIHKAEDRDNEVLQRQHIPPLLNEDRRPSRRYLCGIFLSNSYEKSHTA